jgi:hypothetical protein
VQRNSCQDSVTQAPLGGAQVKITPRINARRNQGVARLWNDLSMAKAPRVKRSSIRNPDRRGATQSDKRAKRTVDQNVLFKWPEALRAPHQLHPRIGDHSRVATLAALVEMYEAEPNLSLYGTYLEPHDSEEELIESDSNLVARAPNDDEALIELIRRDVRYLATELALLRVIEWSLLNRRRQFRLPGMTHHEAGVAAETKLHSIAKAIPVQEGTTTIPLETFAQEFRRVKKRVARAERLLRTTRREETVAKRCKLTQQAVARIRKHGKAALLEAALTEAGRLYGVSPKTARNYYDKARSIGLRV